MKPVAHILWLVLISMLIPMAHAANESHTTATLIADKAAIVPGESFEVGVLLTMEPGWHTYWKNPGDSGLATTIKWTLPAGFTADAIQWPAPHTITASSLVSYGYDKQVLLISTIHWPQTGTLVSPKPGTLEISAQVDWLSCEETCIPGAAQLKMALPVKMKSVINTKNAALFSATRQKLPSDASKSPLTIQATGNQKSIWLQVTAPKPWPQDARVYFYPDQTEVIESGAPQKVSVDTTDPTKLTLELSRAASAPTAKEAAGVLTIQTGSPDNRHDNLQISVPIKTLAAPTVVPPAAAQNPALLVALLFAFLGGIILNLMPCVLPVLSLKVLGFVKQAAEEHHTAWKHGTAFTAGVILSFWVLAGLLLSLRAAGQQLGWGFQMQSPWFVMALSVLFLLFALNLFGVFEIGTSLVGVDSAAAQRGGLAGSFGMGALATVAATPCTAPFMGAALGFAVGQSAFTALLVFTCLGFGMALPYLFLSLFPALLRFVPKPGAWMDSFKQFLGFLLLGTVLFLLWVFGQQLGPDAVILLLAALLVIGLGAWIYGRWGNLSRSATSRTVAMLLSGLCLVGGISWGAHIATQPAPETTASANGGDLAWEPYSATRLAALRAEGKPVFLDFTAAWCLSCKVNETVAIHNDAVRAKFHELGIVLMKADWTRRDPEITKALAEFNRNGVPLYVLYGREPAGQPQILPEVLTPGIVLEALESLK